ncbi:MAG: hypothetical protein NTY38_02120 [Acidobacteria bacterium]|nr:hypothetical protein [Acidobacteriota bacterium]
MCSKGWTAPGASWLLCLAAALSAWGAPLLIDRDGVRNAASVIPGGLPAGGVAPGSVIAIHGEGFLPARELRVVIDAGGRQSITTATAAGARDLRAVLPVETEPGFVSVRVLADGRPSNPVSVRVVPAAFGIFTDDDSGGGAAIPGTVLRGQAAVLRGTGLGPAAGGQPRPGSSWEERLRGSYRWGLRAAAWTRSGS